MTIKDLFKQFQNNFDLDSLNGELTLHKNSIHWTYDLSDNDDNDSYGYMCDEDFEPNFESESLEEQLNDTYIGDLDLIEEYLDEIEELDNWTISESKIKNNIITFTIS